MTTPTLFVNPDTIQSNIRRMKAKADESGLQFRPHFKTHQSIKLAEVFRDEDIQSITVSSLKMARYFAESGWNDITIAFPANILAAADYDSLNKICDLKTLVISSQAVQKLDEQLESELGLYIEIDPDYGRSGVPVNDVSRIRQLITEIQNSKHSYLAGFYCHAGHTYKCRSENEIKATAKQVLDKLNGLKSAFPEIPICYGDTPSCSVIDHFEVIDQLSPGNFVFYDWMQVEIGACTPNDIALWMQCPVIEKFDNRNEILIHGGAVHFSKDYVEKDGQKSFGKVFTDHGNIVGDLVSISQEHGIIQSSAAYFEELTIGDTVKIYPIHSCLTADLMAEYHTISGVTFDHMNGRVFNP